MNSEDAGRDSSRLVRRGLAGIGVAAMVVVLVLAFRPGRRSGGPAPLPGEDESTGTAARVEADPGISLDRLARRAQPVTGVAPVSTGTGTGLSSVPWDHRLRTNGVVDPERALEDEEYSKQLRRHRRIKALLLSPARETPECEAIIELTQRLGITVAAVPDLYNALWEFRTAERAAREAAGAGGREAAMFVAELGWSDFQLRFTRDLGIAAEPVFQELLTLNLHPTVFFGNLELVPDRRNEGLFVEE